MGRAARNINGKVIMYADKVTGSMERALAETERRRKKQEAYNKEHNIEPQGIKKAVQDIMEGARPEGLPSSVRFAKVAETRAQYAQLSPAEVKKQIADMEAKMFEHAKNLEFEQAAKLRDEIAHLQDGVLGLET